MNKAFISMTVGEIKTNKTATIVENVETAEMFTLRWFHATELK